MSKTFFRCLFFVALFLGLPILARAECSLNTNLDFVARDPSGSYIAGARVEVYRQQIDANNHPKPGVRVASATTDAVSGIAHLSWRNSLMADTYAIKVQTISKEAASFWYYNVPLSCGESVTRNETLSGILFILHDADGNLLRNTNFTVYSQSYSASGQVIKEKKESLTSLNSGYAGQVKAYLPQGSVRSIDSGLSDHYALELSRPSGKFIFYNIFVHDGQLTTLDYFLSSLRVKIQDVSGALFPVNTKVEVYKQELNVNNEHQKGVKVGEFSLGEDGSGTIEVTAGIYALGVKGQNGQYQYFWDIEAEDGRSSEYTLTPTQGWSPSDGTCPTNSNLFLTLRNQAGAIVSGLKFELYEQNTDADGLPVAGKKISNGTIDKTGRATITFKPDPRKTYAFKVWDKNADLGDYWFFDAVRFVCGYDRYVTKNVSALKIVLRDGSGALKKNYNFSLYAQRYDADQKPVFDSEDLIANLKTGSGGYTIVYVSPYNTYRGSQTGLYAISAKDNNGNVSAVYNIRVLSDKDYNFQYAFSSLSGELRDARKKVLTNREIRVYEQEGSGANRSLGRLLYKVNTNASGRFQLEYPAGTYALAVLDDLKRENIFWNVVIKAGKTSSQKLVTNLTKFSLADAQGETIPKDASLKVFAVNTDDNVNYYRDNQIGEIKLAANKTATISLAGGTYLVTYTSKTGREYGRVFKANNGQFNTVLLSISRKTAISADQVMKITK